MFLRYRIRPDFFEAKVTVFCPRAVVEVEDSPRGVDPVPETPQCRVETSINTKREKEVTDGVSGENENDKHCARVGQREESILPLRPEGCR